MQGSPQAANKTNFHLRLRHFAEADMQIDLLNKSYILFIKPINTAGELLKRFRLNTWLKGTKAMLHMGITHNLAGTSPVP